MMGTPTTKEITTNAIVERVVTEAEVVDIPSSERVIEKLAEELNGLFWKYVIEM